MPKIDDEQPNGTIPTPPPSEPILLPVIPAGHAQERAPQALDDLCGACTY